MWFAVELDDSTVFKEFKDNFHAHAQMRNYRGPDNGPAKLLDSVPVWLGNLPRATSFCGGCGHPISGSICLVCD